MERNSRRKDRWFIDSLKRTQYEWKEIIDCIEDEEVRMRIALIIWWDFYETRTFGEYDKVFSPYLKMRRKFIKTKKDLLGELAKIYPIDEAFRRLGVKP